MTFSINRSLTSYIKVQSLISWLRRNRSCQVTARLRRKKLLDVGCGGNIYDEFINLDYKWRPGVDICWDIVKGIPLASNSLTGIFTEHCLEHIPFEYINSMFKEFLRLLQPGGILRIVVPDGELYLTRYTAIIHGDCNLAMPNAAKDHPVAQHNPILAVNRIFRDYGHLFIYDFNLLYDLLARQGFVPIEKKEFMRGKDPQLLIDSEKRASESLYLEATKPLPEQQIPPPFPGNDRS